MRPFATLLGLTLALAAGPSGPAAQSVPTSPEEIRPALIGATIPDVTLKNREGAPVGLRDLLSRKPTILILYRGGW